jgi:hypothetical protein
MTDSQFFLVLGNNTVAGVMLYALSWKDGYEWQVRKNLEGYS